MRIRVNKPWKVKIAKWCLDRMSWEWLDRYYWDRKHREDVEEIKRDNIAEKIAQKEMADFVESKGAEFKQELKVSPIVGVPLNGANAHITAPTLEELRKVTRRWVKKTNTTNTNKKNANKK